MAPAELARRDGRVPIQFSADSVGGLEPRPRNQRGDGEKREHDGEGGARHRVAGQVRQHTDADDRNRVAGEADREIRRDHLGATVGWRDPVDP